MQLTVFLEDVIHGSMLNRNIEPHNNSKINCYNCGKKTKKGVKTNLAYYCSAKCFEKHIIKQVENILITS